MKIRRFGIRFVRLIELVIMVAVLAVLMILMSWFWLASCAQRVILSRRFW